MTETDKTYEYEVICWRGGGREGRANTENHMKVVSPRRDRIDTVYFSNVFFSALFCELMSETALYQRNK